jgi:hypothetical protein
MACDEFDQRLHPPRGQIQIQGRRRVLRTKPSHPEAPFGLLGEKLLALMLPVKQVRSDLAPGNATFRVRLMRGKTGLQFNPFMFRQLKRTFRRFLSDAVPNVFHKLNALRHGERFESGDRSVHEESIHQARSSARAEIRQSTAQAYFPASARSCAICSSNCSRPCLTVAISLARSL